MRWLILILLSSMALAINITEILYWRGCESCFSISLKFTDNKGQGPGNYTATATLFNGSAFLFSIPVSGDGENFTASGIFQFSGNGVYDLNVTVNDSTETAAKQIRAALLYPSSHPFQYTFEVASGASSGWVGDQDGFNLSGSANTSGIYFGLTLFVAGSGFHELNYSGAPRFRIVADSIAIGLSSASKERIRSAWMSFMNPFFSFDRWRVLGRMLAGIIWKGITAGHCYDASKITVVENSSSVRVWCI